MDFLENLRCPITKNRLDFIDKKDFSKFNIPEDFGNFGKLTSGLIDINRQYFYPIFDGIIVLHEQYALFTGKGQSDKKDLSQDKQRVFDYYNEIEYKVKDSLKIYEDSPQWVDFRDISTKYIKTSFTRAGRYYPPHGKYILDIASGPIGLPEYMALSEGYEYRICIDISINALIQAKINIERAGKKGIFICGDITNIPIKENTCNMVLSQHTLYHVPKDDQLTAVNEMYRVAKPGCKIVIIYSWFYHSWFMNITLNFVQLYRISRHIAGRIYVSLFKPKKPILYFHPHSPGWFRRSFKFSDKIEFFCWRSTNKYFMKIFIHKWLGGRWILNKLISIEDKHSKFMSKFGEYPAIVITK